MKKIYPILILLLLTSLRSFSQGCIAIKSTGGVCNMLDEPDGTEATGGWIFNTNVRYYRSFRHFIGKQEQYQRIASGNNVINHGYTQDLALTRVFNDRWSFLIDLPVISNTRSSLYEHGGKDRHLTSSFGVGDTRLAAYVWALDPKKSKNFNIQFGLGIKLPTGNDKYEDYFYNGPNNTKQLGPVDQSIQLGDGGTGITTEVNTFYHLSSSYNLYANFYYLISPEEVNGVSTGRGNAPSASAVANGSDVMSVPDQMMLRGGLSYAVKHFIFSAGARYESIPVHDLIGGSNGFRRPGYIFSGEPGIIYEFKKFTLDAFVPIAIIRDRTQSVPDLLTTRLTGTATHGDAAFADYAVNIGLAFKL